MVVDTNVLISHLPLLKSLINSMARQRLCMALMLPKVVIQELNWIKEKNGSDSLRRKAQDANGFILRELQAGLNLVRGQKEDPSRRRKGSNVRVEQYDSIAY